jgi:Capsule assembly protein Wzi
MAGKNVFFLCVCLCAMGIAHAGGFFDADQDSLRSDVQHLANAGLIDIPITTWPLSVDELNQAVEKLRHEDSLDLTDANALERVLARLDRIDTSSDDSVMAAGSLHPTRFREEEDLPRSDGNVGLNGGRSAGRFTAHLEGTFVTPANDGQKFRLDGSYGSFRLGNWLFSAGELPRTYGPSEHDSMILSTNARPIPALAIDRALSTAPASRWLSWIGPWRFDIFLGTLEQNRQDVRSPLFAGARITFKPTRGLEIGLSRTSQFCGEHRRCNFNTFKDLLIGRTNTNAGGITTATDPGNDEAGFDARWVSPIGNLPYAFYAQMIGEDQQGGVPFKYLGQFGFDTWTELNHGGLFLFNLEFAAPTCSFTRKPPIYDCAYRHYIFDKEGYRYKGFVLGSSWEGDAEVVSMNLRWMLQHHDELQIHVRHGTLNKGDLLYPFNIAAPTRRNLNGADFDYRWTHGLNEYRIGAGFDRLRDTDTSTTNTTPTVFAIWRRRI